MLFFLCLNLCFSLATWSHIFVLALVIIKRLAVLKFESISLGVLWAFWISARVSLHRLGEFSALPLPPAILLSSLLPLLLEFLEYWGYSSSYLKFFFIKKKTIFSMNSSLNDVYALSLRLWFNFWLLPSAVGFCYYILAHSTPFEWHFIFFPRIFEFIDLSNDFFSSVGINRTVALKLSLHSVESFKIPNDIPGLLSPVEEEAKFHNFTSLFLVPCGC